MQQINRITTVVEFDAGLSGVQLKADALLTWKEWDDLIKTVESKRSIAKDMTLIQEGFVLPGDKYADGTAVGLGQLIPEGAMFYRKIPSGYEPVYKGLVLPHDLYWSNASQQFEEVNKEAIGKSVKQFYAIIRSN